MARDTTASTSPRRLLPCLAVAAALALAAGPAAAQPFNAWLHFFGHPSHAFVEVPHSAELNPSDAFTFEAWVEIVNSGTGEDCRSIAGKDYTQAWWIGLCTVEGRPTLRSYLRGAASARSAGTITPNEWTHVAVVFDGAQRRHYINGELAASFAETGPLPGSTDPMRIGSDVSWEFTPSGRIDEVRLWNVARTTEQIRLDLNEPVRAELPGLVATWSLDNSEDDITGNHPGDLRGQNAQYQTFNHHAGCGGLTATALCLRDRFVVTTFFRAAARTAQNAGTWEGPAQTVNVFNEGSGAFWFFTPDNWEVTAKALNACALNNHYWVFAAGTTNLFYRLEVNDVRGGAAKIWFNYPGPPAPAITDTRAFATCP